jgi:hypothetical protein
LELFTIDGIIKEFIMLLQSAEDTTLDIMDAPSELALFVARAVIDEVLIPLNLDEISSKLHPNNSGSETVITPYHIPVEGIKEMRFLFMFMISANHRNRS